MVSSINKLFVLAVLLRLSEAAGNHTNVTFDSRALKWDGKRHLVLSAGLHYVRSTAGEWNRLFQLARGMGLNNIQTYVFWNYHEHNRGEYTFEGRGNLTQFLELAAKNNLTVTLRIGPYICGEYFYGGFPIWLREIPGIEFRTYNEPFMQEMQRWMEVIIEVVRPYFYVNGGPIIMAQVENEYRYQPNAAMGEKYADWAIRLADSFKIGVPWNMCHGVCAGDALCTINGFWEDTYDHNPNQPSPRWMSDQVSEHSDQPLAWTEDQGWFDEWGIAQRVRNTSDIAYGISRWFAYGGTYHNFYMFHGGNNMGFDGSYYGATGTAGKGVVTAYEPDVMVDSWGHVHEPRYSCLKKMFEVLMANEQALLSNPAAQPQTLSEHLEMHSYGENFVFVSNFDEVESVLWQYKGHSYYLPPHTVLYLDGNGMVLFNTSACQDEWDKWTTEPLIARPLSWQYYSENIAIATQKTVSQSPIELFKLTKGNTELCWYTTTLNIPKSLSSTSLIMKGVPDTQVAYVFIDESLVAYGETGHDFKIATLKAGEHQLSILFSSLGLDNGGLHLERLVKGLTASSVKLGGMELANNMWTMTWMLQGEDMRIFTEEGVDKVKWQPFTNDVINRSVTWLRTSVDIPSLARTQQEDSNYTSYAMNMTGAYKGFVWVNGHGLGRYYLLPGECVMPCARTPYMHYRKGSCGRPTQHLYHIPTDWLKEKVNVMSVCLSIYF
jgi:hypothetical protein